MNNEYAFEMATSSIRFGWGATREVGMDLVDLGARRVMLVIDPCLAKLAMGDTVVESLRASHIDFSIYDQVQALDYTAAWHTSVLLLGFSFAVLAVVYALQRRIWAIWPAS